MNSSYNVANVWVGASLEEYESGLFVRPIAGVHQRRPLVLVQRVYIAAGLDQHLDYVRMATLS